MIPLGVRTEKLLQTSPLGAEITGFGRETSALYRKYAVYPAGYTDSWRPTALLSRMDSLTKSVAGSWYRFFDRA
jgi:hypothetical protein